MKKTAYFISLAMAALFVSCSGTTDDASISFSVPREIVSSVFKSSDSPAQSDYAVKKIKCTLLDKNEKEIDSQTDDIAENTNTVITFSGIPAGTKLSISATVYGLLSNNENSPEYSLYTGQSGKITVKPGNNTITLKLKETTTTVLYNNTSDTTVSSLSYAKLTSSGLSTPIELLANTYDADTGNSTEIVDYCFDASNNLYAIVRNATDEKTPYSIKKYPYSNNAYGEATAYSFNASEVSSVDYIEAADDGTLYVIYTDANYGVWIANLDFDASNLNSSYAFSYDEIQTFCTDGTNFYIITSSVENGVTDVFLWAYTIQENEFVQVQGKYIHLASTGELAGENDYPLSSYGTSLEYRDLCYINGTLYLLVNDVSTLDVTSRGALCTFTVSDNGIAAGRIDIGYQKTAGSFSHTGDYDQESDSYPTVTQTSYFGDGQSTFYGPVKFIARKEDELVIADEGYSVTEEQYIQNPSHIIGTISSKNAVVTFDLNKQTLNFTSLDGEYFENKYSGYFYGSSIHNQ